MACKCKNIEFGSEENYSQQVLFDIPPHMESYRVAREKDGLSDKICVDPCIAEEIQELWSNGITTYGSCCGHNKVDPFVNVDEKDISRMADLGYIQTHNDKSIKETFRLKSV